MIESLARFPDHRSDARVVRVQHFVEHARAANSWRGYRSDWKHFASGCVASGRSAMPAEPATVAAYLADNADLLKVATLQRRLTAVGKAHQASGLDSPVAMAHAIVRETWRGIRRTKGITQEMKGHPYG